MCEKCIELDRRIEHYQKLSSCVADQIAQEGIRFLIAKYCADKKAIHPDQGKRRLAVGRNIPRALRAGHNDVATFK